MALITCRECKAQVSEEAPKCPQCGVPWPALPAWTGTGMDWQSPQQFFGYPLVHVAFGRDSRGKRRVAKGVIAIGQFGFGLVAIAQFGVGLLFGFGQFIAAPLVVAQFAVGILFALGQFAAGYAAIGQFVLAYYGIAQIGWAEFLYSTGRQDPEAWQFFQSWWETAKNLLR